MHRDTTKQGRRRSGLASIAPLVLGLALIGGDVRASGSVSVEVLGQRCSVSLAQTFRKILGRGGGLYYRRVGEQFRQRIGRVLPAVERVLAQISRRHRALVPYDLRYGRRSCPERGSCAEASRGPHPVLLSLPVAHRGDARHLFYVALPLRRALPAPALAKLRRRFQALIERHGGADATGTVVRARKIPKVEQATARLRLRVATTRRAIAPALPRFNAQLSAVARRAVALVQAALKRAKKAGSPRFGRFGDKQLPPYRIGKPLPAILSLHGGNGFTTISAQVVLTQLRDDRERATYARELERKFSALLPR